MCVNSCSMHQIDSEIKTEIITPELTEEKSNSEPVTDYILHIM